MAATNVTIQPQTAAGGVVLASFISKVRFLGYFGHSSLTLANKHVCSPLPGA